MMCIVLFMSAQSLLNAQAKSDKEPADFTELYKYVSDRYGPDQVLVNGILYTDIYWKKEGHQFLGDDRVYTGNLVFRGAEYKGLGMKYDICNQQLIVFINNNPLQQGIIPPPDFISAFSLEERQFSKNDFQGEPQYYQVVFDNDELKCLYHWSKQTMETAGSGNYRFFHYEFTASKKRSFLYINGSFEPYRKNRSFIDLFPGDTRPAIGHFMKANRIKVKKSSDQKMVELMTYCSTLIK